MKIKNNLIIKKNPSQSAKPVTWVVRVETVES